MLNKVGAGCVLLLFGYIGQPTKKGMQHCGSYNLSFFLALCLFVEMLSVFFPVFSLENVHYNWLNWFSFSVFEQSLST